MATLYPNPTLGEWAVISPNGRFDANNNAQANMFHVYGNQIVPLSTMFEKYYTPKLLSRILAGEKFDNLTDVKKLKKIPKLTLQFKEGNRNINVDEDVPIPTFQTKFANATIVINAECPLDAVSEIRLFQNGKLVETTRNLKVVEDKRDEKNVIKTIQVTLVDGSNTFRAIALNTERSESIPIEMHVEYNREHANNVQKNREKEMIKHGLQKMLIKQFLVKLLTKPTGEGREAKISNFARHLKLERLEKNIRGVFIRNRVKLQMKKLQKNQMFRFFPIRNRKHLHYCFERKD